MNRRVVIIESVQEGLLAFDQVLRLTYMNRATENMLGRSGGELFGKTIWELFPGMDASAEETLPRFIPEPSAGVLRDLLRTFGTMVFAQGASVSRGDVGFDHRHFRAKERAK